LVTAVVSRAELESDALKVAASLAEKDAKTFAANKLWLNRGMKAALTEARTESERHRKD
jgi:enoyl-CoA hydratase/carnithine racemase